MSTIPDNPVGFHADVDEVEYHAHAGSLSQSGAKLILKAPALYRWAMDHPVYKDVFDFGSAAHALVLGVGSEIVVHEYDAEKIKSPKATSAWKAEQAEVRERGAVLLLPSEYAQVRAMADRLSEHTLAMQLLSDGLPEVSAWSPDEETGVLRRCRYDWLGNGGILSDFKTSITADPRAFGRTAADFGYESQAAWYLDVARDLGHAAKAFAFIVQMKEPPFLVSVVELDDLALERGRIRNARALRIFKECTERDEWPGFLPDDQYKTVSLPGWALAEEGIQVR